MSPGSSTESYPAFARIGLRENPGKSLNQVTCPDRDSNPGHLVSRPDTLTVTPQQEDRDITYALFCSVLCIMEQVLFDEILILSVEENPHVYDKRRASHKDEKMKENTWLSIFEHRSTESYPAFARIGLRENPGKNLNQVTCPDRDSNPGHLVSRPDALTVTPQSLMLAGSEFQSLGRAIVKEDEYEEVRWDEEILKSEVNTEIMKQLSLGQLILCTLPQNWLHLYTDGSLVSREQGAGAGVTCCPFSLYRSLGYGTTSFDGEIIAISESLRNLLCHINQFNNAVILSDSKAAILTIVSKYTPSSQTAEITKMLSQLISLNKRIVFQWIPSHCGILGKENADALAKKGSTATYRPVTKSTYYSVKRFINIKSTYLDFNKQNLITQSQAKKWNSLHHNPQLIPDLPRKSSFRLATGHDCLAKHLHRIGIYQSPICPLCNSNQEMDSEHVKICASVAGHDNIFDNKVI
ncbi:hypothetical protein ANN_07711 [Periplaneta americana]|uniref:RNase H type-1 domain-containing protein n=1 Tax=Periplaneta americana TaxID=6978 RepID=A0ABQ8SZC8_PERAM|nr:hypothetical protein ANN_07711 [Periplaneta americana]